MDFSYFIGHSKQQSPEMRLVGKIITSLGTARIRGARLKQRETSYSMKVFVLCQFFLRRLLEALGSAPDGLSLLASM